MIAKSLKMLSEILHYCTLLALEKVLKLTHNNFPVSMKKNTPVLSKMGYLESSAQPILADVVSYTLQNFFVLKYYFKTFLKNIGTIRKNIEDYNPQNTTPPGGVKI